MNLLCVIPAANEPVTLADMCQHLREEPMEEMSPEGIELRGMIAAARSAIESYCRRVMVMQSWEMSEHRRHPVWKRLESLAYVRHSDHGIRLPYAPLLAVDSVQYVAQDGSAQDAKFRVDRGSRTQPGTLWLLRRQEVAEPFQGGSIVVNWRAGYGGTIAGLTVEDAVVTGFRFAIGDVGSPIKVGSMATRILSVDAEGAATLADAPTGLPEGTVSAYLGWSPPPQMLHAIKLLAADMYANREATPPVGTTEPQDDDLPVPVRRLLKSCRNLLS